MRQALPAGIDPHPLAALRAAAALVAERARSVRIDLAAIPAYATLLQTETIPAGDGPAAPWTSGTTEQICAFVIGLGAINFGSGYFPELEKRPGLSGYRTLELCLVERAEQFDPFTAAELCEMTGPDCSRIFGQSGAEGPIAELMELYAGAWRELGELVQSRFGGSFSELVATAGSAESLVRLLAEMPLYRDVSLYDGVAVPFLKRAQLTAADLARALPDRLGRFPDLGQLTIFADNLVPHVLKLDRVLQLTTDLEERIERGDLLEQGSDEEIEIRACGLHAAELILAELRGRGVVIEPYRLDLWLWTRGGSPRYKARPRHRARCVYY